LTTLRDDKHIRGTASAITLTLLAYFIATDIYTPSMPTLSIEFHVHSDAIQKTITFFLLGAVLSCFISGSLADHYGKRKILLYGLALAVGGSFLAVFCTTLNQLLLARFLQGLGGVIGNVVGLAIIHDHMSEQRATQLFGVIGFYLASIPALAPILGGFLTDNLGWRSNFYVLLLFFILAFLFVLKRIPKDHLHFHKSSLKVHPHKYYTMLKTRAFVFVLLLIPLFVSGEWFMISFLPFYFQETLRCSPEFYGIFFSSLLPWYACGSYFAGKYGARWDSNQSIARALLLGLAGTLILLFIAVIKVNSIYFIYLGFSFYFLSFGILFPLTTAKTLASFPNHKATALSLRMLLSSIFAFIGAQAAEIAGETQFLYLALYFCLFSVLALVLFNFRDARSRIVVPRV